MNIGFDLDGVFISLPQFVPKGVIDYLYRGHNHKLFYRIPSKGEQWVRNITHNPIFRPPIFENLQILKKLKRDGNKLYLISSRFSFLMSRTDDIIHTYELNTIFDKMHFNYEDQQPHEFKDRVIKELKITKYIDDDLNLLEYVSKRNPRVQFYWLSKKNMQLSRNLFEVQQLSNMFK